MRKRLFIFAAATCFALSAFATPAFAEEPNLPEGPTISSEALVQSDGNSNGNSNGNPNGNSDGNSDGNVKEDALPGGSDDSLPDKESYIVEGRTNPSGTDPVAKIGGVGYATLQDAISHAKNKDVITLQSDLKLDDGLQFIDSGNTADQWKNITIDAANKYKLTLNNKGIYATHCEVTIKNCPELTVNAGTNPSNGNANISAVFFCPGTLTLDNCNTVNITNLKPNTDGGSGLCIYNGGSLYIQNNTHFTVSGFMNRTSSSSAQEGQGGCSGIYIDSDEDVNNYTKIMGQIVVSDNSTLTATNCFHSGITANPINILVSDNSTIDVNHNNDGSTGYGGLGCYYGTLTVSDHSLVTAYNNTAWQFAVFVDGLDIDGTSKVNVTNNGTLFYGGTGIAISGNGILRSGAELTSSGNCGPGVQVYSDVDDKGNFYGGGTLTVKSGATLSSCKNYNYGLANGYNLNIESGAHVYLKENLIGGLDNYPYATTTANAGADLAITGNYGRAIKNGNSESKFSSKPAAAAKLILNSGLITENSTGRASMPSSIGNLRYQDKYGGGIYNEYGSVSLFTTAKVYNNHAKVAGDDLYNANTQGNSFNIIALEPGAKWSVLDDDGKIIDDWYHDAEGEDKRWKETNAINNTDTDLLPGAALKAAHGINAPTPSPKPVEPTAAPTEAPTPTVAPTAAPTTAPTAAPADNTATAAPATPAPTAQPTVTATPAPTAQASGVIPQTGDSSSPALFSILTLGSITALCVLQKRRKSK